MGFEPMRCDADAILYQLSDEATQLHGNRSMCSAHACVPVKGLLNELNVYLKCCVIPR